MVNTKTDLIKFGSLKIINYNEASYLTLRLFYGLEIYQEISTQWVSSCSILITC